MFEVHVPSGGSGSGWDFARVDWTSWRGEARCCCFMNSKFKHHQDFRERGFSVHHFVDSCWVWGKTLWKISNTKQTKQWNLYPNRMSHHHRRRCINILFRLSKGIFLEMESSSTAYGKFRPFESLTCCMLEIIIKFMFEMNWKQNVALHGKSENNFFN